MEVVKFIYNEKEVDFLPDGNENVMVNATQMAKIFGKQVNEFTSNLNTKAFLNECLKNGNPRYLGIENESDLIDSKQKSGTWMHRVLALKFAAWLDPAFELWVFLTIDRIILGHYKALRDATIEKMNAEKQRDELQNKLLEKYPEDFAEYLEIEGKLSAAQKKRVAAIKASASQIKFDF
jgi:hypothetical protein